MSEARTINGKVVSVEFDIDIPYARKEGTYKGTRLTYSAFGKNNTQCFTSKTLELKADLKAQLEDLRPGDAISIHIVKNAKGFNDIQGVTKGFTKTLGGDPKSSSQSSKDSFTLGQIKGNTVTNAVQLAIHNSGGNPIGVTELAKAAEEVLKLHVFMEKHVDIKGLLENSEVSKGSDKEIKQDVI